MKTSIPAPSFPTRKFSNPPVLDSQRPLRICVVFDEEVSARNAEIMIADLKSDYECDTQSLCFDSLESPKAAIAAARSVAGTDILILAARGDQMLPAPIRSWLGLCLGLRDEGQESALVAIVSEVAGTADLHSSILDYLETIAIIGGVAFFARKQPSPSMLHMGFERFSMQDRTVQV